MLAISFGEPLSQVRARSAELPGPAPLLREKIDEILQLGETFSRLAAEDPFSALAQRAAVVYFAKLFALYPIVHHEKVLRLPLVFTREIPARLSPLLERSAPIEDVACTLQEFIDIFDSLQGCGELMEQIKTGSRLSASQAMERLFANASKLFGGIFSSRNWTAMIFSVGTDRGVRWCSQLNDLIQRGALQQDVVLWQTQFIRMSDSMKICHDIDQRLARVDLSDLEQIDSLLDQFFKAFAVVLPEFPIATEAQFLFRDEQMRVAQYLASRMFSYDSSMLCHKLRRYFKPQTILHIAHIQPHPGEPPLVEEKDCVSVFEQLKLS
jgi:hypothetical protein